MGTPRILVVGAALLDFIGEYRPEPSNPINKIGSVKIAVGGAAFNIAADLAAKGVACSLVTCLRKGSPTSALIRDALNASGIDARYLIEDERVDEPAYVAILRAGHLESGITSSPVEQVDIFAGGRLEGAIAGSTVVAVDTNLSTDQIRRIGTLCKKLGKPLCTLIVADAKIPRLIDQGFEHNFTFVSMNRSEAASAGFDIDASDAASRAGAFCRRFSAEQIILTDSHRGYHVINRNGEIDHIPSVEGLQMVNSLGAGDALFAAHCIALLNQEDFRSDSAIRRVREMTADVLGVHEANLGFKGPAKKQKRDALTPMAAFGAAASLAAVIRTWVLG